MFLICFTAPEKNKIINFIWWERYWLLNLALAFYYFFLSKSLCQMKLKELQKINIKEYKDHAKLDF